MADTTLTPDKFLEKKSPKPALERVTGPSSPLFAPSLAIIADSFPAAERLPIQRLARLLAGDDYRLYSLTASGDVTAVALLYLSVARPFALLDYMAVRADLRGKGNGSTLFREVVNTLRGERPLAEWLLLEVDDDREGSEEQRGANSRRIQFYRRLGARLLANVPYRFPSPSGVDVPMRLMAYGLREEAMPSPQALGSAVEDMFAQIHARNESDPLLRWILANLPPALILQ